MKKIVAIDGNSIMNRAFYGIMSSKILSTTDGIYTNAIYGFLSILLKLLNDEKPDYICVAFDLKAPTFRHKAYEGYKATRKGMPDELRSQMPIIKDVLRAMNIKIFEQEGYEADDILGTIAKYGDKRNIEVLLLTGDRDALQLVTNNVTVRIPITKMGSTESTDYTPEVVFEKYGIKPKEFIQIKGLMGDNSDNIPGVPGVGEKTAFKLVQEFKTIDNIYKKLESGEELDSIKGRLKDRVLENKDMAYLSKDLGTICDKVPLDLKLDDIVRQEFNKKELYNLFVKLQFRNLIEKLNLTKFSEEVVNFDDKVPEIKDISQINLNDKNEIAYYLKDGLTIFDGEVAYYTNDLNVKLLRNIFESNVLKIGFEEKTDYLKLKRLGINPNNMMFDLTIASYILNPSKDSYKLDDLILQELGMIIENKDDNAQVKIDGFGDKEENIELLAKYAKFIYKCKEKLEKQLNEKEQIKLFSDMEMPLMKVLAEMEYNGVLVDRKMLEDYSIDLNKKVENLAKDIYEIAGIEFNVNSPKQLGDVLFEKLKLPVIKKTKTGYSTDGDVLEKLKEEHPVIEKIVEYRALNKLKATYVDGMIPLINQETHRIHAKFNQTVTATGRISCTDPNLQNIPIRTQLGRELRKVFVAPDGNILLDADYSQIELRVLAHISNDDTMIKAFNDGIDIHAVTASQVFGVPLEEVTPSMRTEAKAVNFGIVYGISDFGLAENIGTSRRRAKEYIERYFEKYPKIKEYMDGTIKECKEKGYVETLWGRRRYVPEIGSNNFNVRQFGERVAMNAPIQGTAADIIKIAMINIQKELEDRKLNSKIILQVHDELVLEVKNQEFDEVKEILVKNMENVIKLKVPLKAEAGSGKTWFEAH